MKKLPRNLFAKISVLPILFLPSFVSAQVSGAYSELDQIAEAAEVTDDGYYLTSLVGNLINAVISVLGIVFIILIVYAGFLYMTAQGEKDNVEKAKKLLSQAVIGLVIITSAYAISLFVFDLLRSASSTAT